MKADDLCPTTVVRGGGRRRSSKGKRKNGGGNKDKLTGWWQKKRRRRLAYIEKMRDEGNGDLVLVFTFGCNGHACKFGVLYNLSV